MEGKRLDIDRPWHCRRSGIVRVDGIGHQWSVSGDPYVQLNRRGSFDLNRLRDHRDRLLDAAEFGGGSGGIQFLQIEVLHVSGDVGFAPRDEAITSNRDRGSARDRCADHVELAGRHVREVPQRRDVCAEVWIVREGRFAACRQRSIDHPVVGANRFGFAAT